LTPKVVSNSTLIRGAKGYGREIGKPIKCLRGKPAKRLTLDTKHKRLSFAMVNQGIKEWDETTSCRRSGRRATVHLLPNWPPNSPYLNPIENVWSWVPSHVDAKGCKTFEDFKAEVIKELKNVTKGHLQHYIESMLQRIKKCMELEGDKAPYSVPTQGGQICPNLP
jgi:hypothetical protein